jgi:hypothetical protein
MFGERATGIPPTQLAEVRTNPAPPASTPATANALSLHPNLDCLAFADLQRPLVDLCVSELVSKLAQPRNETRSDLVWSPAGSGFVSVIDSVLQRSSGFLRHFRHARERFRFSLN